MPERYSRADSRRPAQLFREARHRIASACPPWKGINDTLPTAACKTPVRGQGSWVRRPKTRHGSGVRDRRVKSSPRSSPPLLADAHALEPRQHLVAEERQLLEVVDEREPDAAHAGAAQVGERLRDLVGIADHQEAAHAVHLALTLALEFGLAHGRARDVPLPEDAVDRRPVAILDHGVAVVLLGLLPGAPAGDDADRVDI